MEKKLYELKIDEEFRTFCPPMSEGAYKILEKKILREGPKEALIVWNGTIIDGHNRYKILKEHNLPFAIEKMEFSSREEAKEWIGENALGRRNMDRLDRCLTALRMEPYYRNEAKKRQGTRSDLNIKQNSAECSETGQTRDQLARMADVSHDTLDRVKKILQSDNNDLKERLLQREISINKAFVELKGNAVDHDETIQKIEKQQVKYGNSSSEGICDGAVDDGHNEESADEPRNERNKSFGLQLNENGDNWNEAIVRHISPVSSSIEIDMSPPKELKNVLPSDIADTNSVITSIGGTPADNLKMRAINEFMYVKCEVARLASQMTELITERLKYLSKDTATMENLEILEGIIRDSFEGVMDELEKYRRRL